MFTKRIIPALAAAALSVSALGLATTSAQAYYPWGGYHHHGWGYGAGFGIAGGALLAGALIASQRPRYEGDCFYVRRYVTDYYGNTRRVRRLVCE